MLQELLPYYERELTFLRQLAKEFAAQYPKIAGRLQLEGEVCADPHVERLIEAFAFLTARVHKKLDDEFPELTEALLGMLYPHYLRPVPSMAIVQFQTDPNETQLTSRYTIPRHATLFSRPIKGMPLRFRTCYPVDLWPVRITEARFVPLAISAFDRRPGDAVATLRLRLSCLGDMTLPKLGLDRLRVFLAGEGPLMHALYELLCNNVLQVVLAAGPERQHRKLVLPAGSLQPVGFAEDEGMLEYDSRSFLGYRLLYEYFAFPEKFLFFDLLNLDQAKEGFDKDFEIIIYLSEFQRAERMARLEQTVSADTFRLGCAPVVNLFQQQAEPIRLTHEKTEYLVIPDVRRPWGTEVYSVDNVCKLIRRGDREEEVVELYPFHSVKHAYANEPQGGAYWCATRRPTQYKDSSGTDIFLALVDLAFNPTVPSTETLSITVTCTNRDLPAQLPFGGGDNDFDIEGSPVIASIRCLTKPTPAQRPPFRHGAQWRLISHLTLNYLSLTKGGREALLEILSLYNFSDSSVIKKQIEGILDVKSRSCVRRVRQQLRSALVQGTEVTLVFDEDQFTGSGVYLFASVLDHFFGLYCGLNSFTQLVATSKQREKVLAIWPPRAGPAILV
jgi:type VI secretion system protein ImpG